MSEFTSGGGVSSIFAYEWVDADGSGPDPGFLNETPIGSGGDCKSNTGDDSICATTNSGTLPINTDITTPWLTSNKNDGVGNTLRATEFFEGGIDITQVFGAGSPTCFNTFVGDTRSSVSPDRDAVRLRARKARGLRCDDDDDPEHDDMPARLLLRDHGPGDGHQARPPAGPRRRRPET